MASMTSSGSISVRALLARSLYACTALSAGLTLPSQELKPPTTADGGPHKPSRAQEVHI